MMKSHVFAAALLIGVQLLLQIIPSRGFTNSRRYGSSTMKIPARTLQQTHELSTPTAVFAFSPLFTQEQRVIRSDRSSSSTCSFVNNRHSASDWFYNLRTFLQSEILREVKGPVLAVAGWSAVVSIVHRICLNNGQRWSAVAQHMCVSGTAHSFLVSALGLLLVFRTNSAYQRFYEGRKIWENILSVSRNLSRIVHLYGKEIGSSRQRRILNLVAAFPYLLRHHIRPGCLCSNEPVDPSHRLQLWESSRLAVETRHEGDKTCGGVTSPMQFVSRECFVDKRELPWSLFERNSLPKIALAQNRPMWVCDRVGRELMSVPYGPNFTSRERLTMLGQVEKLTNAVGQCERIHQTAVPLNYARHSLRSLTLWLFTLPFCLIKDMGLLTAPVTACVAWALFGVYQIGYSIEDPFAGSLRLSVLCDAIRRDVIGDDITPSVGDATHQDQSQYFLEDIWEDGGSGNTKRQQKDSSDPSSSSSSGSWKSKTLTTTQLDIPLSLAEEEAFLNSAPQLIQENNGVWNVVGVVEG